MKKTLLFIFAAFLSTTAFSCWFGTYDYEDYIYSINNIQLHTSSVEVQPYHTTVKYKIKNNMVVDFPISVSVKLVSQDEVNLGGTTVTNSKQEILKCALQYRVLPNGNWVTVQEYQTPTGTIPSSYPANFYFGRNNISPVCKKGDIIMIRVYVTDGMWQSGDINSMCDGRLTNIKNGIPTLADEIIVSMNSQGKSPDLGGGWHPNLVTTVIWSGKTRPIK